MTNTYTLIAYISGKKGWYDNGRNYMEGTNSNLNIRYFNDQVTAGIAMGEALFADSNTKITILINGLNEYENNICLTLEQRIQLELDTHNIRLVAEKKFEELEDIQIKKQRGKMKEVLEKSERKLLTQLKAKYLN